MPDITIGRLRGGYCVIWTEGGRRRRYQLAARTRAEAEAEGRDRYIRETVRPGGLTVAAIWALYADYLGAKPTAENVRYAGKAVLAAFGALRPDQITDQDCRGYRAAREAAGRKLGSIHTELGYLRSALRWAQKKRIIDRAPDIELPPKPDSDVRPIPDATLAQIIDACAAFHVRLAVILLISTGARVGAVLDLTWSRVDFERGVIDLRDPDGVTRKGRAVVPMNRMARAALKTAYEARQTAHVVEWNGRAVGSIRTGYTAALERAGVSGVNIHQIRHTVAVKMLAAGRRIEEVSQYLGHSNVQITQRIYARFMPEHLTEAAAILDLDGFAEPRASKLARRVNRE